MEFKFTFFHTLFLCICVFSTFLKALETFHLTLKKPPSDFCNQLLKTLWKLDNRDYWTICTQEARKLHVPNFLIHFLLIFLSYMVCCTLFWTFIYHQDHVFFEWKCVLFLPFLLPHIIYFIRLFWKYLMLIRNVTCVNRIIFFEFNALFFQKFSQTDLSKRRLMLGFSWCLGKIDFAKVKKIIWQKRRLQEFCHRGKFPSDCGNLCSLLTYLKCAGNLTK